MKARRRIFRRMRGRRRMMEKKAVIAAIIAIVGDGYIMAD